MAENLYAEMMTKVGDFLRRYKFIQFDDIRPIQPVVEMFRTLGFNFEKWHRTPSGLEYVMSFVERKLNTDNVPEHLLIKAVTLDYYLDGVGQRIRTDDPNQFHLELHNALYKLAQLPNLDYQPPQAPLLNGAIVAMRHVDFNRADIKSREKGIKMTSIETLDYAVNKLLQLEKSQDQRVTTPDGLSYASSYALAMSDKVILLLMDYEKEKQQSESQRANALKDVSKPGRTMSHSLANLLVKEATSGAGADFDKTENSRALGLLHAYSLLAKAYGFYAASLGYNRSEGCINLLGQYLDIVKGCRNWMNEMPKLNTPNIDLGKVQVSLVRLDEANKNLGFKTPRQYYSVVALTNEFVAEVNISDSSILSDKSL